MASNEELMREFATGATRNLDTTRIDPEGFLAPEPLEAFFAYMHKNREQKDGKIRASDNWQLGIPQSAYMKSLWRHFFDLWKIHRQVGNHSNEASPYRNPQLVEDCCAMMFNVMGYLREELKKPVPSVRTSLNRHIHQDYQPHDDECECRSCSDTWWGV